MLVPPCLRARLFANVDGIRGDGRWTALQFLGSAVLNLSETRADDLLQSAWGSSRDGWWHLWGAPSPPREKRGVSRHVAASLFWTALPAVWDESDGCHRFFGDARLSGALIWAGDRHSSHGIAVHCVYGPAGISPLWRIWTLCLRLLPEMRRLAALLAFAQPHESPCPFAHVVLWLAGYY